jgi:hypothetical protein
MPEDNFVMTYPCYLLKVEDDRFISISFDGIHCLILCTDKSSVEDVYREMCPNQDQVQARTIRCDDPEMLLNTLFEIQKNIRESDDRVEHIAIDPYKGRTGYVLLAEMIKELEQGKL